VLLSKGSAAGKVYVALKREGFEDCLKKYKDNIAIQETFGIDIDKEE